MAYVENFVATVTVQPSLLEHVRQRVNEENKVVTCEALTESDSSPGYGVLDSGCGKSIMGQQTYQSFRRLWSERGIPVPEPYPEVNHFRFGNGEKETSE